MYSTALYVARVARRRPCDEEAARASASCREPLVVHDTAPPRIPVPGEAPCADARRTMPTDDSTEALHAADGRVPDGILNEIDTVSTTVVGGTDDTDGLSDGVIDDDALLEAVAITEELTDGVSDGDKDTDADTVD